MIDATQTGAALILGLSGAGHCIGMCGGIAAALNLGGSRSTAITLAYHGGRLASYTLLGALLGFAAGSIDVGAWTISLRYLAGLLLVGMGLYIADWWRGMAVLERAGSRVWQPVQRIAKRWVPPRRWPQGFALGLCWGLMPCGLIYSSLAFAATAQHAAGAALLMLLFGIGTLPAMLTTSLGAKRLQAFLRRRGLKRVLAALLIAAGAWTIYIAAVPHHHAGDAHQVQHHHSGHDAS